MSSSPSPSQRRQATKRARVVARRRARSSARRLPTEWRVPSLTPGTPVLRSRMPSAIRTLSDEELDAGLSNVARQFALLATGTAVAGGASTSVSTSAPRPAPAPGPGGPDGDGDSDTATETKTGTEPEAQPAPAVPAARTAPAKRSPQRQARRVRWQRLVAGAMALLVVAGAGLAFFGLDKVRGSTIGRYVDPSLQPGDPGFAAYVTPTPTLLVVHRAADGQVGGLALLALQPGDQGGSVLVLPVGTVGQFGSGPVTLGEMYNNGGAESVRTWVETVLRLRVEETVEIDDARWATLVGPVGPLTVQLDEPVAQWGVGAVTVQPAEIGPFMSARTEGASELVRADRQALVWQAWLQRVAQVGASAVPGEVNTGIGRFVRRIAAAPDDISALPVAPVAGAASEQFEVNGDLSGDTLARAVPYPASPAPGVRPKVRLLNGTTDQNVNVQAARALVAGGAEISISGNADSFDIPTTRIIYSDPAMKDIAIVLQAFLGIGVVEVDSSDEDVAPIDDTDRIDLTVILGADAPAGLTARR